MTISQFISYLDQQPWKLEYIQNLLADKYRKNPTLINYIGGAFNWTNTPQGYGFWMALREATDLTADKDFTISDLISALHTHYLPTHPEFFI